MSDFIVNGGRKLFGDVYIDGSKNAALPIIFATVAIKGISRIENLPDIDDVDIAFRIVESFGAKIFRDGSRAVIDTRELHYTDPPEELVSSIRASSYLIGACLSRFGRARIRRFGGCNFENRPIDMHICAAVSLGASLSLGELTAPRLVGADIIFDKISVGATVNALILASGAVGRSRIYGYAKEPHVISLADFLRKSGAEITIFDEYIEVIGGELSDSSAYIIPDMIEAGTYILISLATGSSLRICGADTLHLGSFFDFLRPLRVNIEASDGCVSVDGVPTGTANIVTAPYPGFPTDLQPQSAALISAFGGGRIEEGVWKGRFGYLKSLANFGVRYTLYDGYAEIRPSKLHPANATCPDLRGGAAILICALIAEGRSRISGASLIKRGYGNIIKKLRGVGADIIEI